MNTWVSLFYVGLGGALGALARFAVASLTPNESAGMLPLTTLIVNVMGCGVAGFLASVFFKGNNYSHSLYAFAVIGFLGSFTTFSAFSMETFALLRSGQLLIALSHVGGQVVLGVLAVWLGYSGGLLIAR